MKVKEEIEEYIRSPFSRESRNHLKCHNVFFF